MNQKDKYVLALSGNSQKKIYTAWNYAKGYKFFPKMYGCPHFDNFYSFTKVWIAIFDM